VAVNAAVRAIVVALPVLFEVQIAHAQSITTEAALSAGYSTDDVSAAAAQVRAFGDLPGGLRYFGEVAWANTSDRDSDSFSAAYPYANRVQIVDAYAERTFRPASALAIVRAGRFRVPFGISSASDHAYTGFLRAPLIRYDGYFALSNSALEHGVDVVAGVPRLTVETALGAPADIGSAPRRSGLDTVVRVQGYAGSLIIGVSHIRTSPAEAFRFASGRSDFTGVDARWMAGGVQLRGEWIAGRPFDGASTTGGYVDVLMHRPIMGPVTAVARIESLDYTTSVAVFDEFLRRQTVGARVRLLDALSLNVNVLHGTGLDLKYRSAALDVGLTWSVRRQ
jgi:hypothetical protein